MSLLITPVLLILTALFTVAYFTAIDPRRN
jgi:hypothetical protein